MQSDQPVTFQTDAMVGCLQKSNWGLYARYLDTEENHCCEITPILIIMHPASTHLKEQYFTNVSQNWYGGLL